MTRPPTEATLIVDESLRQAASHLRVNNSVQQHEPESASPSLPQPPVLRRKLCK